ncbi:MAG: SMC-Scp complex subunit ScpB [Gammaproteobacteria bacterium]|nr:SMC-Scp complex subunit ScpB [Gammaproteobacteria bacterium]
MNQDQIKNIVEGAMLAAGRSLSLDAMQALFAEDGQPDKGTLRKAIDALQEDFQDRSIEIKETSSGYRIQVKQDYSQWVSRLWEERPTRYSRALLETLALVAYRQPITRGEIEEVRGVSVSSSIIRTLQDRDWVRVVGHRDVPGRPAMLGTTKTFLDYFGLKTLDELPTLAELRDIDSINVELDLDGDDDHGGAANDGAAPVDEAAELEHDDAEESIAVEVHADGLNVDDAEMAEEGEDASPQEEDESEEESDDDNYDDEDHSGENGEEDGAAKAHEQEQSQGS